ncbi:hypothetical protein BU14_3113s0001 [Porphyra umbilicalis]|uniref:Uncharacterized protein n=1 Tax=Porphyra umbilicalis TaxID=2786 RepID=A0A1X6NI26_PORUM|nr:hypothetical protein BU14_3113s0001 [Porphyra umbilicalis]|eukprot:OSX68269.1 hypothetical protein BU14_3113s0001 [Porphyra umbilicalis]
MAASCFPVLSAVYLSFNSVLQDVPEPGSLFGRARRTSDMGVTVHAAQRTMLGYSKL